MSIFDGADPDLDLGDDHALWFYDWNPDPALNPQYRDVPPLGPGEHFGAHIRHRVGPHGRSEDMFGEGWCVGSVGFDVPTVRAVQAIGRREAVWQVQSWSPLTISPSVLCDCGDHGFIRNGLWVPA